MSINYVFYLAVYFECLRKQFIQHKLAYDIPHCGLADLVYSIIYLLNGKDGFFAIAQFYNMLLRLYLWKHYPW